jgi:hypothetical protein
MASRSPSSRRHRAAATDQPTWHSCSILSLVHTSQDSGEDPHCGGCGSSPTTPRRQHEHCRSRRWLTSRGRAGPNQPGSSSQSSWPECLVRDGESACRIATLLPASALSLIVRRPTLRCGGVVSGSAAAGGSAGAGDAAAGRHARDPQHQDDESQDDHRYVVCSPTVLLAWRFRSVGLWAHIVACGFGTRAAIPSVTIASPVVVASFTMTRHRTSHVKPRAVRALRADVHPRDGERHRPHPAAGTRSGVAPAAHELRQLLRLGAALAARLPERRRGPGGRAREGGRRVSGRHNDGLVRQRAASRFGAAVRALPFMSSPSLVRHRPSVHVHPSPARQAPCHTAPISAFP